MRIALLIASLFQLSFSYGQTTYFSKLSLLVILGFLVSCGPEETPVPEEVIVEEEPEETFDSAAYYVNLEEQRLAEEAALKNSGFIDTGIYHLTARSNFHLTDDLGYLRATGSFKKTELLFSDEYCQDLEQTTLCLQVNHYAVGEKALSLTKLKQLNQSLFGGNTQDDTLYHGKTAEFRLLNEELVDSIAGIWFEADDSEYSYTWDGGESNYTDVHPVLHFEMDDENYAEWVIFTDTAPKYYAVKYPSDSAEMAYYEQGIPREFGEHLIVFYDGEIEYAISYAKYEECGFVYDVDIEIWKIENNTFEFFTELYQMPVVMLDVDRDGDLDILFEEDLVIPQELFFLEYEPVNGIEEEEFGTCGC